MRILDKVRSDDGAMKYLLGLEDGMRVEAVFLALEDNDKDSLCISSQVGCPLTCRFCATGKIGFGRNLTATEIAEQVRTTLGDLQFSPRRRFDLSYMGMGEPLLNLPAVVESKNLICTTFEGFYFYISTVGVAPKIRELATVSPDFTLQISLHSPFDDLRQRIMPINAAHPIKALLDAGEIYASASKRAVVLNYCLMADVNDLTHHAFELVELIRSRPFRVQLVNFNPHTSIAFSPSTDDRAMAFLAVLKSAGVPAHYGRQLGLQEGAGCGQLDADYHANQLSRRDRDMAPLLEGSTE